MAKLTRGILSSRWLKIGLLLVCLSITGAVRPEPAEARCVFEYWTGTWFEVIEECVVGPPNTCGASILVCGLPQE